MAEKTKILDEAAVSEIEAQMTSGDSQVMYETANIDNVRALCATVKQLRAEVEELSERLIKSADRSGELLVANGDLQSQLEQLRAELAEEKRLRSELKQIAQTGIAEVSSVGTALKDIALIDFRSRAIQLCQQKADEWNYSHKGDAARQIAELLEKLQ